MGRNSDENFGSILTNYQSLNPPFLLPLILGQNQSPSKAWSGFSGIGFMLSSISTAGLKGGCIP